MLILWHLLFYMQSEIISFHLFIFCYLFCFLLKITYQLPLSTLFFPSFTDAFSVTVVELLAELLSTILLHKFWDVDLQFSSEWQVTSIALSSCAPPLATTPHLSPVWCYQGLTHGFSFWKIQKWVSQRQGVQFRSVTQSCPTLCNPIDCSMQGFPVHHQLLELFKTHVHWVHDAIQPSHPLLSPSPAFNLS